jgi:hypothetical protein
MGHTRGDSSGGQRRLSFEIMKRRMSSTEQGPRNVVDNLGLCSLMILNRLERL